MIDIADNIRLLQSKIPSSVKLVAVTKNIPVRDILTAYNCGLRHFGENRVQELLNKNHLPSDIEWHMIGHLQSNKVKYIVPFISMIQSVDSYKLLRTINLEASKIGRMTDCLLQMHIASEETKFGFSMKELIEMAESQEFINMKYVRMCGVMGMATFTSDNDQVTREFDYLADCFNSLKNRYFFTSTCFKNISMGMSGDYEIAVNEGSTIVRIGSRIFGVRKKLSVINN
jgi:pyridoxal phosphate enzyme (YggS family)